MGPFLFICSSFFSSFFLVLLHTHIHIHVQIHNPRHSPLPRHSRVQSPIFGTRRARRGRPQRGPQGGQCKVQRHLGAFTGTARRLGQTHPRFARGAQASLHTGQVRLEGFRRGIERPRGARGGGIRSWRRRGRQARGGGREWSKRGRRDGKLVVKALGVRGDGRSCGRSGGISAR